MEPRLEPFGERTFRTLPTTVAATSRYITFFWMAPLFGVLLAVTAGIAAPLTGAVSFGPADGVRLAGFALLSAVAARWLRRRGTTRPRYSASTAAQVAHPMQ